MSELARGKRYSLRRLDGYRLRSRHLGASFALLDMDYCWREVWTDYYNENTPQGVTSMSEAREKRARDVFVDYEAWAASEDAA